MCNDSRVNKQHIRSSCSKAPVKAKPSFSMTKLHVWAVVTTFYYSTSYTLLEPSGTSHDFLIKTIFSEYLRIAIRLKEERIFFSPCYPSHAWDGREPALLSPLLQQSTNIAMCCFHGPGTPHRCTSFPLQQQQQQQGSLQLPKQAVILRCFHYWRGCAWTPLHFSYQVIESGH